MTRIIVVICVFLLSGIPCGAYSALTHEAVIDAVWDSHIKPLLLHRFPRATPDELKEAHSYVYGGCLIQDMGYVPFSAKTFSDLTHYARSGDFVATLIRDAETLNEYGFALGSLAHYASDHRGHPTVNHATAVLYPKLRAKFGDVVTYEESPASHLKTEFAFDVVQVSRGSYAPDAYHDFIGFHVSKPVLERAFKDTYGIEMKDIFGTLDLGIGTYRFSVGKLIPEMTKAAWQSKRSDIEKQSPGITRAKFVYHLPTKKYRAEWKDEYRQPGIFARFVAAAFHLLPKVGPFKVLAFKPVSAATEQEFLKSFESTVEQYRARLAEVRQGRLNLANYNLDTGKPVHAGDYEMADKVYAKLLDKLAQHHFEGVKEPLRKDILTFFSQSPATTVSEKTRAELEELKTKPAS